MTEIKRKTLEDALIAAGRLTDGLFACPACGRGCLAFEIVEAIGFDEFASNAACGSCLLAAESKRAAGLALTADLGWAGDLGLSLKAQRDVELDKWAWTIRPDSPLSDACLSAFADYLKAVGAITLDFADPQSVTFPQKPDIEYASPERLAARLANYVKVILDA
jgi:hypothetical protein